MKRFVLFGFLPFLFFAGVMVILFNWEGAYFSSSNALREAYREEFERYTVPSRFPGEPIPDLSEIAAIPEFTTRENSDGSLNVIYSHIAEANIPEEVYTVIEADENLEATLNNGEIIRIAAIGITMPEEMPELDGSGRATRREDVDWLNPVSHERQEKLSWQRDRTSEFGTPTLHIAIEREGDSPHYLLGADVFDAKTMAPLVYRRSTWPSRQYGHLDFQLQSWHATDLLLLVPMLYGVPEVAEIDLIKGARIEFEGRVSVTNVVEIPGNYWPNGSSGSFGDLANYKTKFVPGDGSTDSESKYVGLFVWPPWSGVGLEYFNPTSEEWNSLSGSQGGLSMIATKRSWFEQERVKLKVRRLPHFAKVVFRIKALPRFSESENLFTTPIKKIVVNDAYDFTQAVAMSIQAENDVWRSEVKLDHLQWPLTFEDTTPLGLLQELERLGATPLYFDEKQFILTPEFPEPFWMLWKNNVMTWLKGIAP